MDSHLMVEKANEELIKGKETSIKLMKLLRDHYKLKPSNFIVYNFRDLVAKISGSFESAIQILNSGLDHGQSTSAGISSTVTLEEHSSRPTQVKRDRRGCYKRRKQSDSCSISPTMEDGYAWRKYGQKIIHSHAFPRCYFKCTHHKSTSTSAGCKATKQVQKWEKDQSLYQTTYFGEHTCSNRTNSSSQLNINVINDPTDTNPNDHDALVQHSHEEMEDKNDVINQEGTVTSELPQQPILLWDLPTFHHDYGYEYDYEDVSSTRFDYNYLLDDGVDIDMYTINNIVNPFL